MLHKKLSFISARVAAGVGTLGVAVGLVSNIGNAIIRGIAPTPLEFATRNGVTYTPQTVNLLKEFNDIRVIPADSRVREMYCTVNHQLCEEMKKSGNDQIYALSPKWWWQMLGVRPTVFLKPLDDGLNSYLVRFTTGKITPPDPQKSLYAFNIGLFHELGHINSFRRLGVEKYYSMTDQEKELDADRYALPTVRRENGKPGTDYLYHFRALTQLDSTHDVLLPLLQPTLENYDDGTSAPSQSLYFASTGTKDPSGTSYSGFQRIFQDCAVPRPLEDNPLAKKLDDLYRCLQAAGVTETPGTTGDRAMEVRTSRYVAAYTYFFHPVTP